jgi:hypothetical protein
MTRAGNSRALAFTLGLALGVAAAVGCAQDTQFVQVRERRDEPLAIQRLAVAPFRIADRPGATPLPADAGALVGGYVAEAFQAHGLDVLPPSDVAHQLGFEPAPREALDPRAVVAAAHRQFGADAVVFGSVYRFRDRSGQAMGSTHSSSVGFDVRIVSAPGGALLWAGAFDETQVPLSENLLRAPRYPGGGTRWLTAEELARFGAGEVAQTVPLAAR